MLSTTVPDFILGGGSHYFVSVVSKTLFCVHVFIVIIIRRNGWH